MACSFAARIARRPPGTASASATTSRSATPAQISSDSTLNVSASGPNTAMPNGIDSAMTIPTNPNTRPCISGSTVSWSTVYEGVEKVGTDRPSRNMNAKNTQRLVDSPRPIEMTPNTSVEIRIIRTRFHVPAHAATAAPPSTMPMLNASSLTVSFHTSSPNVRTIISGVRNDGATMSTKTTA